MKLKSPVAIKLLLASIIVQLCPVNLTLIVPLSAPINLASISLISASDILFLFIFFISLFVIFLLKEVAIMFVKKHAELNLQQAP